MSTEAKLSEAFYVGPKDDPDRYRLGEPVGAGAEGTLYRGFLTIAADLTLDVAIKMLHPHHRPQLASWQRRWGEQVELLRSLHATGLVAVRDGFVGPLPHPAGVEGSAETLYLVMNFLDGIPIDVWADRHRELPDRDKLRLLLPVAAGLDLMHSGAATGGTPVIHGDVKPGNVLIAGDRTVLVDFGMMRSLPGGRRDTSVTGTVNYLAPEVLAEGVYTPAADRYAFGGVAYYLLTGRHPSTDQASMRAALTAGGRDVEMVEHVMQMFAPADARPVALANWCAQLRDSSLALTILPRDLSSPTTRPSAAPVVSKRRITVAAAVAGVVAAVLAGSLAIVWARSGSSGGPARTYAFAVALYPNNLVVSRTWSTGGRHDGSLHSSLRIVNASRVAVTGSVDEVITKSVAATATAVHFSPKPEIVNDDPVVRYRVHQLPPGEAITVTYDAPLRARSAGPIDLDALAAEQRGDDARNQQGEVTLTALRISPTAVTATVGDRVSLGVTGTMSDGQAAAPAVLEAVAWSSGDPARVAVAAGTLIALAPGPATVTAQAGTIRVDVPVLVTARNEVAAPTTGSSFTSSGTTKPPGTAAGGPPTAPGGPPTTPTTSTSPRTTQPPQPSTTSPATSPSTTTTTAAATTTTVPLVRTIDDSQTSGPANYFTYRGSGWLTVVANPGLYNDTTHHTPQPNDSFVFTFSGIQASWCGNRGPRQGIADITVDGVPQASVDTYAATFVERQTLFSTGILADGLHTLSVVVSGLRNPASTNYGFEVDYAKVVVAPGGSAQC